MRTAYICDALRTPFGRYGGALSSIRPDDLGAVVLRQLVARNSHVDWEATDDVIFGCTNQAGEDNRNVARMALLLAGLPERVPGVTVNRLCGSSMEAVASGARAIRSGDADLVIAAGVESMSRAPFVLAKAAAPFSRSAEMYDTTIGWRFANSQMQAMYGLDSMPATAENVAEEFGISREDQDAFAWRSQQRWRCAAERGFFDAEIVPLEASQGSSAPVAVRNDEQPRPETTRERLAKLPAIAKLGGTVTAGNSCGLNDGAAALLLASGEAVRRYALEPIAMVMGGAAIGIAPRIMGFAPAPATRRVLSRMNMNVSELGVIEINEAFAAQVVAVLRDLKIADDDERVNPNGGAIAIGHPLGASGARLVGTAAYQMRQSRLNYGLCTMCIGVGQGMAVLLKSV